MSSSSALPYSFQYNNLDHIPVFVPSPRYRYIPPEYNPNWDRDYPYPGPNAGRGTLRLWNRRRWNNFLRRPRSRFRSERQRNAIRNNTRLLIARLHRRLRQSDNTAESLQYFNRIRELRQRLQNDSN